MKANGIDYISYVIHFLLVCLFAVMVVFVSRHVEDISNLSPLFIILGGFATFRMARTISFNPVMNWLRAPFTHLVNDTAGGSKSVEPNEGNFKAIGELMSCPICSGTWSALMIVTAYVFSHNLGWTIVWVLGLAGISETLHWLNELFEHAARNHQEQAGTQWLLKNKGEYIKSGMIPEVREELDMAKEVK